MIARLLATVCLLSVGARIGRSESVAPSAEVDLYLKIGHAIAPATLTSMQEELGFVMEGSGAHLEFRQLNGAKAETSAGFAVVVDLRGECGVPWHAEWNPASSPAPLASTAIADGEILPFSWIDCGAVSRLIGPSISDEPDAQRDYVYGRALARVLAHELFHVLTQNGGHAGSGLAKAKFSAAELLSERFQFEGNAFKIPVPARQVAVAPDSRTVAAEADDADFK